MNISGEIIVVEDDEDDREFLREILESLNCSNKVVFFPDSTKVVDYLANTQINPFMVLSDINMPKLNGYELRDIILKDHELNIKCVPYIFLTTSKNEENVIKAYKSSVHGYFTKGNDFEEYKKTIGKIIEYWKHSLTPAQYI